MEDEFVESEEKDNVADKTIFIKYKCRDCGLEWYVKGGTISLICDFCQGKLEELKEKA